MITRIFRRRALPAIALGFFSLFTLRADVAVVGGTTLLTQSYADQIGVWLGEGDITLTNIFTGTASDTTSAFHAAVDGKGRTFAILQANPDAARWGSASISSSQLIGGYDPLSWNSSNSYNTTADRSGFIFNLTTTTIQRQNTGALDSEGQYQTANIAGYGPTFGGGHDLNVGALGFGQLNNGYAFNYSYGGTDFGTSITGGPSGGTYDHFDVSAVEVFTISDGINTPVPEPGSWGLFFGLVAGLGLMAYFRKSSAA